MTYLVLLAVSLLLSAIGFWRYIYFFSVGYGFAVAGIGITLLILFHSVLTPVSCIACILFIIYGVRLGGYLMIRELKSAAYNKILKPENDRSKTIPAGVKIAIWAACAILYFLQTSPVIFRLENAAKAVADGMASVHIEPNAATDAFTIDLQSFIPTDGIAAWIGLCLMALGILLEIAADAQKTAAKKKNPDRFVDSGLYRIVRCPNYLGEMLLWTGVLVSGIPYLQGAFQWIIAVLGFLGITYVMFSGARRLELRQDRNYGDDPVYQKYVSTVPIMIPLIPLYSVKNWKAFVA